MEVNDCVLLKVDILEKNLSKGMQGVIVAIFEQPEIAYEVEFCDENGETVTEIALKPEFLEKVKTSHK